ncbi:helicase, partial [Oryctes borbonicus]
MFKAENTGVRRPSRLSSFNDSNPNEPRGRPCSLTSSKDGNNKGDLKPGLVINSESRIPPKANEKFSVTIRKDENEEESVKDKTQHKPPQNSFNCVQQAKNLNPNLSVKTKSHLPPSAIKQLYENGKGVKATLTSIPNSHYSAVKNINLAGNRLIGEISLRKKLVGPIDRTIEIESIIRGRGKSKVFVPKNESNNSSNEDGDSWEDIDENNSSSQDAADCSLTKSSLEDLNCDMIPKSVSNSSESDVEVPVECRSLRKKLKLGCQCENCLMWDTNDFAEEDEQFADLTSKPKTACQPPPFLKGESTIAPDTQMKRIERNQTKIQKDISPCLLVHSLQLPRYISDVADVAFCQSIHRALSHLKLKSVYTIQSYAWPAIMRLMNTCLVGAPQSGKSLCYLPAICTFVIEKQSRYCELPKENSPIAVIICESAYKAEEIYNLFISILKYTREKVAITLSIPPFTFHNLNCIKSCDILVATPRTVINLIRSRHINLKRLCHFVVEDADKLLIKYGNDFETLTKAIQRMLNHRVCFYGVQVITVSERWTRNLETFLKKLDSVPIICISNYLQCAIYGQAKIQMHFVSSPVKIRSICDIVKESSRTSKTVIVCNDDDDVVHMSTLLQIEGASVTSATSNMMAEDIHEQELVWNSTKHGRYSVLVCTDSTLNIDLNLTQAHMLIHYKLPQDHWTDFSKRFKCLLDNYNSPLNSKFQSSNSCKIHVYVSEECSKQYPRLYRFLTQMGLSLPPKFVELSMNMEMQEEQVKIENNSPVCKRLKLLGKCAKFRCNKRHVLSKKLDIHDWIPNSGIIKFQLLSVQDGTLFGVRLLEYIDTNRNLHKIVDHTEFIRYDLTRDVKNNKIFAINVSVGELYAWLDDETDLYHRCKVLKIFNEFKITKEACHVLVKLIDIGKEKRVQAGNLCMLPSYYVSLPPQSIDAYLANVLPLDEDEHWCAHIKNQVLGIMNSVDGTRERCYFSGRILLQIGETLWLDDIKLQEDLQYSNDVITIFSLKKKMLEKQLCSDRNEQLHGLYTICKNCNITLPNYEVKKLPEVRRTKQVKPQWAYLEDGYNVVYFCSADSPTKFYVRQEKYHKIFQQLQNEIQQMILKPFYPETKDVLVNHCYLAQDPNGDEYGRVIVRNIQGKMVDCFFVDFGDSTYIQKDELKFLPDNTIMRLPFQAIECTLFGVKPVLDSWPDEATDVLYDHCFEANTNIYKNLYVKQFKSIQSEHKGRNVYSVVVVDYVFEKPIFLNNVLVDCGFASLVKGEL